MGHWEGDAEVAREEGGCNEMCPEIWGWWWGEQMNQGRRINAMHGRDLIFLRKFVFL
jgi:hypothetical protein